MADQPPPVEASLGQRSAAASCGAPLSELIIDSAPLTRPTKGIIVLRSITSSLLSNVDRLGLAGCSWISEGVAVINGRLTSHQFKGQRTLKKTYVFLCFEIKNDNYYYSNKLQLDGQKSTSRCCGQGNRMKVGWWGCSWLQGEQRNTLWGQR